MSLSSSKTTSTSGPSAEALPYLTAGSTALQSAYNANQGNTANIGQGLNAAFSQFGSNLASNPTTAAANGYIQNTLNQPYTANPNLESAIGQTNNDITDRINALFSHSGQTGSSRQIGELSRQLSANEGNMRGADFTSWQQRQQAAAGLAPGMQTAQNSGALALGTLGSAAASEPYIGAQMLSSGLGGLWGNSQTQTTTSSPSIFGTLAGLGGAALGGWASGGFK